MGSYDIQNPYLWGTKESVYPGTGSAWSGQPILVAPPSDYFTPNTKPPAENFNYVQNQVGAGLSQANDFQTFAAISNWRPSLTGASGIQGGGSIVDVVWDPYYQRWVCDSGAGTGLSVSYDGGNNWITWGTIENGTHDGALAINPNTGEAISIGPNGSGGFINHWSATGIGSQTSVTAFSGCVAGQSPINAATYFSAASLWIATAHAIGFTGHVVTSPDGTTWTDKSSSLPSTSRTGSQTVAGWYLAQSPSLLAICLSGVTYSTIVITNDGSSFIDFSPSFLTGKIIAGIKYNASDALWGLLVSDGTSSYIYTTPAPNGGTWTLVKTFTGRECTGLEHIGRVWFTVDDQGRMRTSNQVAALGASGAWGISPFSLLSGGISISPLRANGTQAMAWTTTHVYPSFTSGWAGTSAAY